MEEGSEWTKRGGQEEGTEGVDEVSVNGIHLDASDLATHVQHDQKSTRERCSAPIIKERSVEAVLPSFSCFRFRLNHGRDDASFWGEDPKDRNGYQRGSKTWWREQYYEYEVHSAASPFSAG